MKTSKSLLCIKQSRLRTKSKKRGSGKISWKGWSGEGGGINWTLPSQKTKQLKSLGTCHGFKHQIALRDREVTPWDGTFSKISQTHLRCLAKATVFQLKIKLVWLSFWVILERIIKIRKVEGHVQFKHQKICKKNFKIFEVSTLKIWE